MTITIARYSLSGATERFYQGVTAARSQLLADGFIIALDRDGYLLQNPTTGEIATLSIDYHAK